MSVERDNFVYFSVGFLLEDKSFFFCFFRQWIKSCVLPLPDVCVSTDVSIIFSFFNSWAVNPQAPRETLSRGFCGTIRTNLPCTLWHVTSVTSVLTNVLGRFCLLFCRINVAYAAYRPHAQQNGVGK